MEGHQSIVIAVFSTSSGIGKTITAINLAAEFAKDGYQACLVDLDLQFGDVMSYLKLSSGVTLADAQNALLRAPENFRIADFLTEYRHEDVSFSVLPPPRDVYDAYTIKVSTIENIIYQLSGFNFIILDLPAVFSALNLAMLDLSTIINFIGVMDFLPAVKNYKIGYDTLLRFGYEEQKVRLVENRSDSQKFIRSRDVERLLGTRFYHRLPNDFPAVSKSIREGRPLMFAAPQSALTRSYWDLVGLYTGRPKSAKRPYEQKEPGAFMRFFGM